MRIEILAFDGAEGLDMIGPWGVLQVAQQLGADFDIAMVGAETARPVITAFGLQIVPTGVLGENHADLIIVPGGGWATRATIGTWAQVQRGVLSEALAHFHRQGAIIASVCSGAMLLAFAGLLKNRRATSHRSALEDLRATGAQIVDARVVDEGDVLTSAGVTAGLDLALHLTERYAGAELAERVAQHLEYQRNGPVLQ